MLGKLALSALVVVAIGAAAAVAYGAIPSADGSIIGCYSTITGAVRVVDEGQVCRTNESPLSWNQQGIQGIQGEQGPQGPQGIQGPAGTTATSNVYFASFRSGVVEGGQGVLLGHDTDPRTVLTLQLPPGAYVIEARVNLVLNTVRTGASFASCRLPGNAGTRVSLNSVDTGGADTQNSSDEELEITTAIDHAGGEVVLTCNATSLDDVGTSVSHATLLATPVGAVNPPGA